MHRSYNSNSQQLASLTTKKLKPLASKENSVVDNTANYLFVHCDDHDSWQNCVIHAIVVFAGKHQSGKTKKRYLIFHMIIIHGNNNISKLLPYLSVLQQL